MALPVLPTAADNALNDTGLLHQQYQPVLGDSGQPKRLGGGSFGEVFQHRDVVNNEQVALKRIALTGLSPQDVALLQLHLPRELENHYILNHPHVVKLKDVFLTDSHLNIVLELAGGGTLLEYVNTHLLHGDRSRNEAAARWYFQQVVLTVDYFHRKGVAHRDIKLENTLLQPAPGMPRPYMKVSDFGFSKHDATQTYTRVGTLDYMGPEVVTASRPDGTGVGLGYNGEKADIWSTGVLLYTMLCGRYPFDLETLPEQQWLQRMTRRPLQLPDHLAPECRQLLEGLLHPNPDERMTVDAIKQHPWFLQGLPTGALQMNDRYINAGSPCRLTPAELQAVIAQTLARIQGQAANN